VERPWKPSRSDWGKVGRRIAPESEIEVCRGGQAGNDVEVTQTESNVYFVIRQSAGVSAWHFPACDVE
jgi:hypothetical protein